MNRKESFVVYALSIASITAVAFFFGAFISSLNSTMQTPSVPQGYLLLQTETFHALEVWQRDNETRVNDTSTVLNVWYNVTYNGASGKIEMSVWKSDVAGVTTFEAYSSWNTSQAIQWAVDNTDRVVQFHKGSYNLTQSIFLKSNITLYGMGSVFTYDTKIGLFSVGSNVTDVLVSGFDLGELP